MAAGSSHEQTPMATEAATLAPSTSPPTAPPQLSAHPYVGILGVFLGASIATMNGRLISVGLPDLRGALGLGFDEASWIPTALNMAMMFSGVFCVFLNARFGPRRILLPAAAIFTITSIAYLSHRVSGSCWPCS
jgi:DHA2 family multidrug resistance protein